MLGGGALGSTYPGWFQFGGVVPLLGGGTGP